MRRVILASVALVVVFLGVYGLGSWRRLIASAQDPAVEDEPVTTQEVRDSQPGQTTTNSLSALDAHGFKGIEEISKPELVKRMTHTRSLSQSESTNLDRGCLGLTCVYQGLGLRRWPELALGTVAYLKREDALHRHCPDGQQNFIFLKQGWWSGRNAPTPHPLTGEVPLDSVTRIKVGFYTFNYAVYFPSTETYAWMNHREYGFPANLVKPQKAYLSSAPPPLDDTRPAQIYCSTCR